MDPRRKEVNALNLNRPGKEETMKKWERDPKKVKEAISKRGICPLCRATGGFLSISSLLVLKHIFMVLERRKALKRMNLVRLVSSIGPAQRWVKEVLDKSIDLGWLVQDPKTKIVRIVQ